MSVPHPVRPPCPGPELCSAQLPRPLSSQADLPSGLCVDSALPSGETAQPRGPPRHAPEGTQLDLNQTSSNTHSLPHLQSRREAGRDAALGLRRGTHTRTHTHEQGQPRPATDSSWALAPTPHHPGKNPHSLRDRSFSRAQGGRRGYQEQTPPLCGRFPPMGPSHLRERRSANGALPLPPRQPGPPPKRVPPRTGSPPQPSTRKWS